MPALRAITVRDLMTHTSGLQSGGAGSAEASRLVPRNTSENARDYIPKLGAVPLDFQPGTAWRYSALSGIEMLGRIVEVASGMTVRSVSAGAPVPPARHERHDLRANA